METLNWKVDGEWLTDFARKRLWEENRPYDEVEAALSDSLVGDEIAKAIIIPQILSGKKKLVGTNNFNVVDDDDHKYPYTELSITNLLHIINQLKDQNKHLMHQVSLLQDELSYTRDNLDESFRVMYEQLEFIKEINERLNGIQTQTDPIERLKEHLKTSSTVDRVSWIAIFGGASEETMNKLHSFCNQYNMFIEENEDDYSNWMEFHDKETGSQLQIEDFISRGIIESSVDISTSEESAVDDFPGYGFLTPAGEFIPSD